MSTITELEEKVKELLDEIETLKREKKNEEFEYNFEEFESYWTIGSGDDIYQAIWSNHDLDFERYSQGNVFQTKADAERERDKRALLTRFRQFRDKCNGDWKPEIYNTKYYIYFNPTDNKIKSSWNRLNNGFHLFGYFQKEEDCDRAIELFGDEIKRLYLEW